MLKQLSVDAGSVAAPKAPPATELANRVFRAMHGYYGALFVSRWSSGSVDPDTGEDCGVSDAMRVWAYELRSYPARVVLDAIARCKTAHPEFPPSLPQFDALCKACAPREVYRPPLPMSPELQAERNRVGREKLAELRAKIGKPAGAPPPDPIHPLVEAICDATRCAGGDEAAALRRLEPVFVPKAAA